MSWSLGDTQVLLGHPLVDVYDFTVAKYIVRKFFLPGAYIWSRRPKEIGCDWSGDIFVIEFSHGKSDPLCFFPPLTAVCS